MVNSQVVFIEVRLINKSEALNTLHVYEALDQVTTNLLTMNVCICIRLSIMYVQMRW
jgi:hypothetical protein